jgi:hypothetical protein
MIVAHRLLKNSIDNNEYLLITEKLLKEVADSPEDIEMEWSCSSEEYASIGKVEYRFALLNEARKNVPEPTLPQNHYRTDNTSYFEMPIAAGYLNAYMKLMYIPERHKWMPGLQKVEQDTPEAFVGSIHLCTFENYKAIVSPLKMTFSDEGVMYAESCRIEEMNLSLVYEFVFKKTGENTCRFAGRFMNAIESPVPEEINAELVRQMQLVAEKLKEYCEKSVEA